MDKNIASKFLADAKKKEIDRLKPENLAFINFMNKQFDRLLDELSYFPDDGIKCDYKEVLTELGLSFSDFTFIARNNGYKIRAVAEIFLYIEIPDMTDDNKDTKAQDMLIDFNSKLLSACKDRVQDVWEKILAMESKGDFSVKKADDYNSYEMTFAIDVIPYGRAFDEELDSFLKNLGFNSWFATESNSLILSILDPEMCD